MKWDKEQTEIVESIKADAANRDRDINAGRVLYLDIMRPGEGCWPLLEDFARVCNQVAKGRKPLNMRLLMVYDKTPDV